MSPIREETFFITQQEITKLSVINQTIDTRKVWILYITLYISLPCNLNFETLPYNPIQLFLNGIHFPRNREIYGEYNS